MIKEASKPRHRRAGEPSTPFPIRKPIASQLWRGSFRPIADSGPISVADAMHVEVLQGEAVIGSANLAHLDPSMGVAFGPFTPSSAYDRARHASVVDGVYVGDKNLSLRVRADNGVQIRAGCAIEDFGGTLGEWQLSVYFADHAEFASHFPDAS